MKKLIFGMFLALISALAFALPSPHQIEDALASQHYSDARSMVQQVLEEKPDSARAHLLDAFILIHVDHNKQAASQELDNARRLDGKGDVKNSPLFGRTAAEIDMTKQSVTPTPMVQQSVVSSPTVYQQPVKHESGHGFLWFMIFVLVICIITYLVYRMWSRPARVVERTVYTDTSYSRPALSSPSYSSAPRVQYSAPPTPIYNPAPVVQSPPVVVVGGSNNNGFVEGMLIGEMLEDRNRSHYRGNDGDYGRDDDNSARRRRNRDSDDIYSSGSSSSSYDSTPSKSTSYASDRQSYSSGSDDSWSSRSSSSSYDSSSSSSSSWDSGSSSSYDSGSSSSSSDW